VAFRTVPSRYTDARSIMSVEPTVAPASNAGGRNVVIACLASTIEWYDFAVYGALASVLAQVLMPPGTGTAGLVAVFAVFATSFIARPFGTVLVGLRADRFGRRPALVAMIVLMSLSTAAIGLLPTWSAAGVAVPVALVLLRFVQGFSSGGGLSSSLPLVVESSRPQRWGLYGGWHTASVFAGIALGTGVAGLLSAAVSDEAMSSWGWRIPFLVALPLGLVGLYGKARLLESQAFARQSPRREPISVRSVWTVHAGAVRRGFVLVGVLAGTMNLWFVFLPAYIVASEIHPLPVALACAGAGLVSATVAAPLFGRASDRVGRRPFLMGGNAVLCVVAFPMYAIATQGSTVTLLVADMVVGIALGALVVGAHVAEQFPVAARATGIALTFGLATALIGGTAPLLGSVLARAGVPAGIAAYIMVLAVAGILVARRAQPPLGRDGAVPRSTKAPTAGNHPGGHHPG
jgi:MFS transporter, MHS family, proline/betaine transporter